MLNVCEGPYPRLTMCTFQHHLYQVTLVKGALVFFTHIHVHGVGFLQSVAYLLWFVSCGGATRRTDPEQPNCVAIQLSQREWKD